MIVGAIGVVAIIDAGELRIGHEEILREQSTRSEQPARDDLAPRLHGAEIGRVQQPGNRREIAVRDNIIRLQRCRLIEKPIQQIVLAQRMSQPKIAAVYPDHQPEPWIR